MVHIKPNGKLLEKRATTNEKNGEAVLVTISQIVKRVEKSRAKSSVHFAKMDSSDQRARDLVPRFVLPAFRTVAVVIAVPRVTSGRTVRRCAPSDVVPPWAVTRTAAVGNAS